MQKIKKSAGEIRRAPPLTNLARTAPLYVVTAAPMPSCAIIPATSM